MEIKVYATLRAIVSEPSGQLIGFFEIAVEQMLDRLYYDYPDLCPELFKDRNRLHPTIHILVNRQDIRYFDGFDTILTEKHGIRILPPIPGGCW